MSDLITILISVLIFGSVIFIHEAGHFFTAKLCGIRVNEFSIGMGPRLLHFGKGETTYSLRLLPIGGFVSMEGEDEASEDKRAYNNAPVGKRILVIIAGAVMNLVLGLVVLAVLVSQQSAITSRTVSWFQDGASTQASGLEIGDTIIAVNGRRCYIADDVVYEFLLTQNGTADLTVLRDGVKTELKGVVFTTTEAEDGTKDLVIDFKVEPIAKTPLTVIREAALWTLSLSRMIFRSLVDLITGHTAINTLSGPVGIVSAIGTAASYGWQSVALLMAMITINLGVFNLIPFPALDGGKLFLLIIEALVRRRIPEKFEIAVNVAGFAALMCLMVFVTYNDVTRLITG